MIFVKKYFVVQELWAVKESFSTYVCTGGFYSCGVNCNRMKGCKIFKVNDLLIDSLDIAFHVKYTKKNLPFSTHGMSMTKI